MNNTQSDLELILAHLLGKPINSVDLQQAIERVTADLEAQAMFERLAALLSWQDDPDWLEAIAAASEGLTTPEMIDFLADWEALAQLAPNVVAHFERLLAPPDAAETVALPAFPTFVEQFKTGQKKPPLEKRKMGATLHQAWDAVEVAGQQVSRLFIEIPVLIGREIALFGQLPSSLTPATVVLPARRSKAKKMGAEKLAQVLPLLSNEHDLSISLKVGPISGDKATLSIQVQQTSSQQLLSRARVSLQTIDQQPLESDLTRESGTVTFQNIEPGSYLVEVRYRHKVLELPITFMPAGENSEGLPG